MRRTTKALTICAALLALAGLQACRNGDLSREEALRLIELELSETELFTGKFNFAPIIEVDRIAVGDEFTGQVAEQELMATPYTDSDAVALRKGGALDKLTLVEEKTEKQANPPIIVKMYGQKYHRVAYYFIAEWTPEAAAYIVQSSVDSGAKNLRVRVVEPRVDIVKAVTEPAQRPEGGASATALFEWVAEPTPFSYVAVTELPLNMRYNGRARGEEMLGRHEGKATFTRYDDGWRLGELDLGTAVLQARN